MAKKALKSSLPLNDKLIQQVCESIADLLTKHTTEISENIEEAEDRNTTVNFAITLDCSESAPNVDVRMRFSSSVTDRRTLRCDDPNQMSFTSLTQEELQAEKDAEKAAKKAKKSAEAEANDDE